MMHHRLKSFPPRFQAIWDLEMIGERRNNTDRNFQKGDIVTLVEGVENGSGFAPTGRELHAVISFVDKFPESDKDLVTLSYKNVHALLVE